MRTIRTIGELRAWLGNARAEGRTVGLVPTMGAFHAGHHALMRAARAEHDAVVVSLFVNPAQFNDAGDLAAYPRSEANDAAEAADPLWLARRAAFEVNAVVKQGSALRTAERFSAADPSFCRVGS